MGQPAHPKIGELISVGQTSEVYEFGSDSVIKILNADTPQRWADVEATLTQSVWRLGVPAPEVLDQLTIGDRAAIVFTRIEGPTMWQAIAATPAAAAGHVRDLVAIQRSVHQAGVPDELPSLVDRMHTKVLDVAGLTPDECARAQHLLDSMSVGGALLHGDLHPGNVMLGKDGPYLIDWFDASVGHPDADIARTRLLVQPTGATDLRHLPHAEPVLVGEIAALYDEATDDRSHDLSDWMRLVALTRIAEQADLDLSGLFAMWAAG